MSGDRQAACTAAVMIAIGAAACSDGALPSEAFVVQLFRPIGIEIDAVELTASQGDTTRKIEINAPFVDCEQNRVRIIPHAAPGASPEVQLVVHPIGIRPALTQLADASKRVTLPVEQTVPIILGDANLVFPADCAPPSTDAGVAPKDASPDATDAMPGRPLGADCEQAGQCADGVCLERFLEQGAEVVFSGGYCTHTCLEGRGPPNDCGPAAICRQQTNAQDEPNGDGYCIKRCSDTVPCSRSTTYTCTTANICWPD